MASESHPAKASSRRALALTALMGAATLVLGGCGGSSYFAYSESWGYGCRRPVYRERCGSSGWHSYGYGYSHGGYSHGYGGHSSGCGHH